MPSRTSSITRLALRVRRALARRFFGTSPQPQRAGPRIGALPGWARVGKKRRAHIRRVAALLEQWADAMEISRRERQRWLKSCWLHDALRDAALPGAVTHGVAAADLAAQSGESDRGVLDAVRYHSVGYAGWDDVGKMLYLADYLEPGRGTRRKQRAEWAKRVPRERDAVLREIVAREVRSRVRRGKPVDVHTVEFWNSLIGR
jgi:HD superfamily phosphohydrolase YqeK